MKEKNYNSPWSLKFNTAALVLIPAAVGINYIGKLFAGVLKLPLWLDSIGTCLAACLAGPVVGAIAGAANNLIYGLTMDPLIDTADAFMLPVKCNLLNILQKSLNPFYPCRVSGKDCVGCAILPAASDMRL